MKKVFKIIVYIFAGIGFVLVLGYIAIRLHLTNSPGIIESDQDRYLSSTGTSTPEAPRKVDTSWDQTEEWKSFAQAVIKDQAVFQNIENLTGINSRLIMAMTAAEQLRLYYDNREVFKKIFEPLKILGSESQFSWGVTGIKEDTAVEVESYLKDPTSPFFTGAAYEHLLDFQTADPSTERFNRITDQHNHYYSYLYAALYVKEIESQWHNTGFDISNRPEILATLYNIGFNHSVPNADPRVGGAPITIGGKLYSFGGLSYDIYYSNELLDSFPIK